MQFEILRQEEDYVIVEVNGVFMQFYDVEGSMSQLSEKMTGFMMAGQLSEDQDHLQAPGLDSMIFAFDDGNVMLSTRSTN